MAEPQDIELAYLGAAMTIPEVLEVTTLRPDQFESAACWTLFEAMLERHERGHGISQSTMGDHELTEQKQIDVQDIWYQGKRVLRTVVQVVLGAASVLAVVVLVAPQVLDAIADVVPGPVLVWLTGAVATLAAISAALTKVMAIPKINELLTLIGLGSVPKSVAKETAAAKSQELQPAQFDPSTVDYRDAQNLPDA